MLVAEWLGMTKHGYVNFGASANHKATAPDRTLLYCTRSLPVSCKSRPVPTSM